jgi:hypothetical protein
MRSDEPLNELEQAFVKAGRGAEGYPELFRQLRKAKLFFLIPYHPEAIGEFQVANGNSMTFVQFGNKEGETCIPILTSELRVKHALEKLDIANKLHGLGEMNGMELFDVLRMMNNNVCINAASGLGEITMNPKTVEKIADGSILTGPDENAPQEQGKVEIVNAADYPTKMLQPLFQFLREQPAARAAWLFRQLMPEKPAEICYVFGLLITGDGKALKQDFSCIANSQSKAGHGVFVVDLNNPTLAAVLEKFPPFFAAPDFRWPDSLRKTA